MVFDHDVFPIVRVAGHGVDVHDFAIGNGTHFVEWLTAPVAVQGANVDPFMKTGVNDACRSLHRIAYKTVATAFPRRGLHSLVIALDVLIKCRAAAREESIIVRWQDKIDDLILSHHCGTHQSERKKRYC